MTDVDKRLGYHGADEVKNHPFFKGVNWNNIKALKVPFIPEVLQYYNNNYQLKNELDTKYFDEFNEEEPFHRLKTVEDDEENLNQYSKVKINE